MKCEHNKYTNVTLAKQGVSADTVHRWRIDSIRMEHTVVTHRIVVICSGHYHRFYRCLSRLSAYTVSLFSKPSQVWLRKTRLSRQHTHTRTHTRTQTDIVYTWWRRTVSTKHCTVLILQKLILSPKSTLHPLFLCNRNFIEVSQLCDERTKPFNQEKIEHWPVQSTPATHRQAPPDRSEPSRVSRSRVVCVATGKRSRHSSRVLARVCAVCGVQGWGEPAFHRRL